MENDYQLQTIQSTSELAKEIDTILSGISRYLRGIDSNAEVVDVERILFGACVFKKHLKNVLIEKVKDKLREKYVEVNRLSKYKLLEELINEGPLNYVALSILEAKKGELHFGIIRDYYKKFSSLEEFEKTITKFTARTQQKGLQSTLIKMSQSPRLDLLLEIHALESAWTEAVTKESKVNLIDTILNFDTPRPSFAAVLYLITQDTDIQISSTSLSIQCLAILSHKLGEFIALHGSLYRNLLEINDTNLDLLGRIMTRQKLFRDSVINFLTKYFLSLETQTIDQVDAVWIISEENCDKFPGFLDISIDEVIHFLNYLMKNLTLDIKTNFVKEIFDNCLAKRNPVLCEYVKYYVINSL